ncbi:probable chitinase 10 [Drosophila kikkawai]|uniref:Probable chitinase 10 n=1 Tax=Drosophila kikkawai TaxID=30033 RepID=A0A6P4JHW7_DROKI|nr:peritrophin-1 [Drosophila kikkawai]
MLKVFGSLLFLFLGLCLADVFEECNDGINLSFITSPKSCAHYIFCNGDESYDGECEDGEYFSSDMEMCEPMGDIDCRTGQAIKENSTEVNSEAPEASGDSSSTAAVVNSTLAPTSAIVTVRPSSNETGTTPATVISPSIDVIVANMCPQLDNQTRIVLLPNQNSCSDYYICYRGESLPMSCAASLHFNSRSGKCDHPENVKCMTMTSNPREQCKRHTIDVYPHSDNCNYFYQCRLGYLIVQQCPFFYGWDYEKRSCVALSQAKCYNKVQMQMKIK